MKPSTLLWPSTPPRPHVCLPKPKHFPLTQQRNFNRRINPQAPSAPPPPPSSSLFNPQPLYPPPPSATNKFAINQGARPPPTKPSPTLPRLPTLPSKFSHYKINQQITTPWVQVKQQDDTLSPPTRLTSLLASLHDDQLLYELSPQGSEPNCAIVKLSSKAELHGKIDEQDRKKKDAKRKDRDSRPKQLEVNWAIGGHDLELKLKQMGEFVEKGRKVEVLFAAKRRQRRATTEEAEAVLEKFRERIGEIEAKEIKAAEGVLLKQMTLTVQKTGA